MSEKFDIKPVMVHDTYAFTITLHPSNFKRKPRTQYKKAVFAINNVMENNKHHAVLLECEPELTKAANIHFHGMIMFIRPVEFTKANFIFQNMFRNNECTGFVYLSPIDDPDKWYDYCTKNKEETRILLNWPTLFTWVKVKGRNFEGFIEDH